LRIGHKPIGNRMEKRRDFPALFLFRAELPPAALHTSVTTRYIAQ